MRAHVLPPSEDNVRQAAEALRRGEVVALPTETVYGLAGSCFDEVALARIFGAKDRPTFDPLIVHVPPPGTGAPTLAWLEGLRLVHPGRLGPAARARAEALMRTFWPGPLTLVLPKHSDVPDLVTSGLATVAIRMPRHPVAQAVLREARVPLAAPSANRFGRISPTSAQDVSEELGDRIGLILDGGRCEVGVESTVVAVAPDGALRLLRPGGIPREEIARAAGSELENASRADSIGAAAPAPGMLESHYAPAKPLRLLEAGAAPPEGLEGGGAIGLLVPSGDPGRAARELARALGADAARVVARTLTRDGAADEAARNLFAELRFLDASEAELILAYAPAEDEGLWHAVRDRLERASRGWSKPGP